MQFCTVAARMINSVCVPTIEEGYVPKCRTSVCRYRGGSAAGAEAAAEAKTEAHAAEETKTNHGTICRSSALPTHVNAILCFSKLGQRRLCSVSKPSGVKKAFGSSCNLSMPYTHRIENPNFALYHAAPIWAACTMVHHHLCRLDRCTSV